MILSARHLVQNFNLSIHIKVCECLMVQQKISSLSLATTYFCWSTFVETKLRQMPLLFEHWIIVTRFFKIVSVIMTRILEDLLISENQEISTFNHLKMYSYSKIKLLDPMFLPLHLHYGVCWQSMRQIGIVIFTFQII